MPGSSKKASDNSGSQRPSYPSQPSMFAQHSFPSATANGQLGSFTMSVVNNQTGPWAMKGMELNQRALQASNAGNHIMAEKLHREALDAKKRAGLGWTTVAISHNALGEELLTLGRLEEAEEQLKIAMELRSGKPGHEFDAAVTRENLAQVYHAMMKPDLARNLRIDGEEKGELCCSNYKCSLAAITEEKLKQCVICKCSRYCSVECQTYDWTARHKKECKKLAKILKEKGDI